MVTDQTTSQEHHLNGRSKNSIWDSSSLSLGLIKAANLRLGAGFVAILMISREAFPLWNLHFDKECWKLILNVWNGSPLSWQDRNGNYQLFRNKLELMKRRATTQPRGFLLFDRLEKNWSNIYWPIKAFFKSMKFQLAFVFTNSSQTGCSG